MDNTQPGNHSEDDIQLNLGGPLLWLAVIAVVTFIFLNPIRFVPSGHVQTVSTWGDVQEEELQPGMNFIIPVMQTTRQYTVQTQTYTMSAGEDGRTVQALTEEGLNLEKLDISVRYHLKGESASNIHRFIGYQEDIAEELLKSAIRSGVRTCTSQFSSSSIYSENRTDLAECIRGTVEAELKKGDRDYNEDLVIETVQVRNIMLPEKVREKIQKKENFDQQLEIEQKKIEISKKQKKRKRIDAEADAQANRILSESLTKEILAQRYIEAIKSGDVQTIYLGGSNGQPSFVEDLDAANSTR